MAGIGATCTVEILQVRWWLATANTLLTTASHSHTGRLLSRLTAVAFDPCRRTSCSTSRGQRRRRFVCSQTKATVSRTAEQPTEQRSGRDGGSWTPRGGGGGGAGAGPGPRCCADVPPRRFVNSAGFVNYGQHDECAVSIVKVRPA